MSISTRIIKNDIFNLYVLVAVFGTTQGVVKKIQLDFLWVDPSLCGTTTNISSVLSLKSQNSICRFVVGRKPLSERDPIKHFHRKAKKKYQFLAAVRMQKEAVIHCCQTN